MGRKETRGNNMGVILKEENNMKLTKANAKNLSVLKWQWIYDNPSTGWIEDLPYELKNKLASYKHHCPLCTLYQKAFYCVEDCPLVQAGHPCVNGGKGYETEEFIKKSWLILWSRAKTPKTAKKYAGLILKTLKEWKV